MSDLLFSPSLLGDPDNPLQPYIDRLHELHGFIDRDRDYREQPPLPQPQTGTVPVTNTAMFNEKTGNWDRQPAPDYGSTPAEDATTPQPSSPMTPAAPQSPIWNWGVPDRDLHFRDIAESGKRVLGAEAWAPGGRQAVEDFGRKWGGPLGEGIARYVVEPAADLAAKGITAVGEGWDLATKGVHDIGADIHPAVGDLAAQYVQMAGMHGGPHVSLRGPLERPARGPITESGRESVGGPTDERPSDTTTDQRQDGLGQPEATGQIRAGDTAGSAEASPPLYASRGASPSEALVSAPAVRIHEPQRELPGASTPPYHELDPALGSQEFYNTVATAKQANPEAGPQVTLKTPDEYAGMRLFTTPDRDAGFALDGDDIVSVFKHPDAPHQRVTRSMLDLATQQGGRRLDAFDTFLPRIYSDSGFRAVARIPWADEHAPEGWDYAANEKFNNGRPDVVFMVHDPENAGKYQPGDGKRVDSYEEGVQAQQDALGKIHNKPQQHGGVQFKPASTSGEYATVPVDVAKLDASWRNDQGSRHTGTPNPDYVGPLGAGGIKGRYEQFQDYLGTGQPVETPHVSLSRYGEAQFGNGRHRFAVLRDQGHDTLPVTVPAEQAREIRERFAPEPKQPNALQRFGQTVRSALGDTSGGGPNPFIRKPARKGEPDAPIQEPLPHEPSGISARERAQFTNPRKIEDAHYVMPEGAMLGTGDHDHEYIASRLGYGAGEEGIQRFKDDTGAIRLNHPDAIFGGPPRYMTDDGYTLEKKGGVWTDGDMSFNDRGGRPVDANGQPVSGWMKSVPDVTIGQHRPTKQQVDQIARYVDKKGGATIVDGSTGRLEHVTIGDQARAFLQPAQGFIDQIRKMLGDKRGGGKNPLEALADGNPLAKLKRPLAAAADKLRVSTRLPFAKGLTEDPHAAQPPHIVGLDSYKQGQTQVEANAARMLKNYSDTVRFDGATDPHEVHEKFINHLRDNILHIWDSVPKAIRERSKLWYVGANKLAHDWAGELGHTPQQVAGVMAALSPRMDWFKNVAQARRLLDFHRDYSAGGANADHTFSPEAEAAGRSLIERTRAKLDNPNIKPKDADKVANNVQTMTDALGNIAGKRFQDVTDPYERALWARFHDDAHADTSHRALSPEGDFLGDTLRNKNGSPTLSKYVTTNGIQKALEIIRDGELSNISRNLGDAHKVRNFYNNIVAPHSKWGDLTNDTHAIAAGLMKPLGQSDWQVLEGLGNGGTSNAATGSLGFYPIYAEAYRRAATLRKALPREMQSVTWEGLRGIFDPSQKRNPALEKQVDQIWRDYAEGRIDAKAARRAVYGAAGLDPKGAPRAPTWVGSNP